MSPRFQFVKTPIHEDPSNYPLIDIGTALEETGWEFRMRPSGRKVFARAGVRFKLLRNFTRAGVALVIPMMGANDLDVFPNCYWSELVPVVFDCWPNDFDWWKSFFIRYRIRLAFFTARQAAEHFSKALTSTKCVWLPEATDPHLYDQGEPLASRPIDVLELGRKNHEFHDQVRAVLEQAGYRHLYERAPRQFIFPDRAALGRELCKAKISVCVPASITHPERSGWVNTTTHRYFESMAAKCLLVGVCPPELADLFGYNPVVEIEKGRETAQLLSILKDPGAYQNLVDRNYDVLLLRGTWKSRIPDIVNWTRAVCT